MFAAQRVTLQLGLKKEKCELCAWVPQGCRRREVAQIVGDSRHESPLSTLGASGPHLAAGSGSYFDGLELRLGRQVSLEDLFDLPIEPVELVEQVVLPGVQLVQQRETGSVAVHGVGQLHGVETCRKEDRRGPLAVNREHAAGQVGPIRQIERARNGWRSYGEGRYTGKLNQLGWIWE